MKHHTAQRHAELLHPLYFQNACANTVDGTLCSSSCHDLLLTHMLEIGVRLGGFINGFQVIRNSVTILFDPRDMVMSFDAFGIDSR